MALFLWCIDERFPETGINAIQHNKISLKEGPEWVKWELGFAYFWRGKWDFMHWDCDSSAIKQCKIEMGLRFQKDSH